METRWKKVKQRKKRKRWNGRQWKRMKEFKEREGKGWRIEELRKSEAKKNSGSRSRRAEMGGGEESPRVFGPCLSSSFVPKLRLFSWPSFSRFVHPWAQSRMRVRKRERKSEKENDSEEREEGKRTKHAEEG